MLKGIALEPKWLRARLSVCGRLLSKCDVPVFGIAKAAGQTSQSLHDGKLLHLLRAKDALFRGLMVLGVKTNIVS